MRTLIAVAAGFLAFSVNAGEIYKWVDKDGRVHYGDRPKTAPAESVSTDRPGFNAQPVTPEQEAAAAAQRAACKEQTDKYEKYKAANVIKQTDAFGETREFTPEERERFLDITRQEMKATCSAPIPPPSQPAPDSAPPDEAPADNQAFDDAGGGDDADEDSGF